MTNALWKSIKGASKQYTKSPGLLLQAIIRGSNHIRYQIAWKTAEPKYPDLMNKVFLESKVVPT